MSASASPAPQGRPVDASAPVPALKLTIYIPNFQGGGVERITLLLIDAFIAQGVDVSVVVHQPSGALRSLLPDHVTLVSLEAARSLTALPKLAAYLHRAKPDVLLSSLGHNNVVALWARRWVRLWGGCKTRVVICQHNALSSEARSIGNWQHRVLPTLYRWFCGEADAIVGVSDGVSDDMARVTGIARARITTIHNPVLDARFATALDAPSTHPWLRDPALKVVVGIGRLVPQKDFPTLIRAFAILARGDTRLLLLGEGPERERLEALVAHLGLAARVAFLGFELNPLPTLRDASVMALSSAYEGFGNVLVEALGAGVPVVSTRCPFGPDEILQNGRYGLLVPVGDAAALAAAIGRQLDAPFPARALRMARARDFHVDIVSRHYLALFDPRWREHPPATGSVGAALGTAPAHGPARGVMVYLPNLRMGGGEMSLMRLVDGFATRGVAVTLVVNRSDVRDIAVPAGVALVSLGTHRSLFAITRLASVLRQHRPGVVLTGFPHSNVVAMMASRLARVDCRVVLSEHAPMTLHNRLMGGWRYRYLPPFVRWAYPRADAIVAVSQGVSDDLRAWMPRLVPTTIPNPVLPPDWSARADAPSGHAWLEDRSLEVVLSVSRLTSEKDLPTLVDAFALVSAQRPAARLVIAGEGAERGTIERRIAALSLGDRVQLTGLVHNPMSLMRRARVVVLASRYEGFGNVLVEALAAGTQVVSTDCPVGPREVLEHGRLGQLVPVGDARAMAAAIGVALESTATRTASAEAHAAALQYTQERACGSYLALFDTIEARKRHATGAR